MATTLRYLHFDGSDDGQEVVSFEAMAAVAPEHWGALQHEITEVLNWAHHRYPGVQGPIDEDGDWDVDLHASLEHHSPLAMAYHPGGRRLTTQAGTPHPVRYHVTLTLSGSAGFASAFCEAFVWDGD